MTALLCLIGLNVVGWMLFRAYERHLEAQIMPFREMDLPRGRRPRRSKVASRARYSGILRDI
jgi:hypothetical protein